jgi:hypothetical protein
VSVYAVNKVCRRLVHEPELREALASDATAEARCAPRRRR